MKTTAGYIGCAWSERGVFALTLPHVTSAVAMFDLDTYTSQCEKLEMFAPLKGEVAYQLEESLQAYMEGQHKDFTSFPVDLSGYTLFQKQVLKAARKIVYGETATYRDIAEMIGKPQAFRAVGNALGANRVLYLVPCHRVIKSDGSAGGFGGNIKWKKWLLQMEGIKGVFG